MAQVAVEILGVGNFYLQDLVYMREWYDLHAKIDSSAS